MGDYLTVYDDVDLGKIPKNAEAVAGYVDGRWPTFRDLAGRFPRAHHLSISVGTGAPAAVLDVESGDATLEGAAVWTRHMHGLGMARPAIYCSLALARALVDSQLRAGIARNSYRLWLAHWTHVQHICGRHCGLPEDLWPGMTQWTDRAHNRSLDASYTTADWLKLVIRDRARSL